MMRRLILVGLMTVVMATGVFGVTVRNKTLSAADFDDLAQLYRELSFTNCEFPDGFSLNSMHKLKSLQMRDSTIHGHWDIYGHHERLEFENCEFLGWSSLYLASSDRVSFEQCVFKNRAYFHSLRTPQLTLLRSVFYDDVILAAATLDYVNLVDTKFHDILDFSGATLGSVNTSRMRVLGDVLVQWDMFGNDWLSDNLSWALAVSGHNRQSRLLQVISHLTFWKTNFEQLGQRDDAFKVSYELNRVKLQYIYDKSQFKWWHAKFFGLVNDYGAQPYRPIVLGAVMVFVYALIYFLSGNFVATRDDAEPLRPKWLFCLLYSVETFTPLLSITGLGTWAWRPGHSLRWVVVSERLIGLGLVALAIYSIGVSF